FIDCEIFGSSGGDTKLRVVINEGKNRGLRRFFGHFDLEMMDLRRVAFAALYFGMLKAGKHRYLVIGEYANIRDYLKFDGIRY
ncbi:rRNA pseudouridine synthase, partial [Campylobacter jejuni]